MQHAKTPGTWIERLEDRELLSAATGSMTLGNTVYTAVRGDGPQAGADLYRSDTDELDKVLFGP